MQIAKWNGTNEFEISLHSLMNYLCLSALLLFVLFEDAELLAFQVDYVFHLFVKNNKSFKNIHLVSVFQSKNCFNRIYCLLIFY